MPHPHNGKRFPRHRPRPYEDVRDDIRSGDLLMCSGTAVFSRMIKGAIGVGVFRSGDDNHD